MQMSGLSAKKTLCQSDLQNEITKYNVSAHRLAMTFLHLMTF